MKIIRLVLSYRCVTFRYIAVWSFVITMITLTSIFYYDLQQQSINSSSVALPFDNSEINKDKVKKLLNSTIYYTPSMNTSVISNRATIQYYRQYVQRKNHEQLMYNGNLFSSKTTRYILLVQVHKRVVYFKKFIEMLHAVRSINQTLLIFSHDFIDPEINILVKNISFVPVSNYQYGYN